MKSIVAAASFSLILASIGSAQTHRIVLEQHDALPGLGPIQSIFEVAVADDGTTYAEVVNANSLVPWMVLKNGAPYLSIGSTVGGYLLSDFENLDVDSRGGLFHKVGVRSTPSANTQGGVLRNGQLLVTPISSISDPNWPGAVRGYIIAGEPITPSRFLASAVYFIPFQGSTDALFEVEINASGGVARETILHLQGEELFAGGPEIIRIPRYRRDFTTAADGHHLWVAELAAGGTAPFKALVRDSEILIRHDDPSGVPGLRFQIDSEHGLAIHENGDWAARLQLRGNGPQLRTAIVKNGKVLYKAGDVLPALAPHALTGIAEEKEVWLTDEGDVIWFGAWEGPSPNQALFLNDRPILIPGVTEVEGQLLLSWDPNVHPHASPNGTRMLTQLLVADPVHTLREVLVETVFDIGETFCSPVNSSLGRPVTMAVQGSPRVIDQDVTLRATNVPTGSFIQFFTSQTMTQVPGAGGSLGLLCVGGAIGRYSAPGQIQQAGPTGRVELSIDVSAIPTPTGFVPVQVGETLLFQAWYRDTSAGAAVSNFSDAVQISFE